ncbi:hypothetical protein OGAPHI_006280 [Ogataea philodendri]|uniref:Ada DNA repair metal-binding domain-containing protein n=1 Tax=Ogataea philodendri TaxID=1378263 RepID=A0A9P8NZW9_9ASCO|nr:uncharacterized protein OGAPHI_006280 [Ogataea philodendri]KAH3662099.1 hypothetical protein OGAPHI_006280 [Ogataea philodendri]
MSLPTEVVRRGYSSEVHMRGDLNLVVQDASRQAIVYKPFLSSLSLQLSSKLFTMYSSEQSKWVAFQFKDPFAADKFFVCHVGKGTCCRPNCDLGFSSFNKSDIKFVDQLSEAVANGFRPCKHCLPDRESHPEGLSDNFVSINLDLLVKTVEHVNESIGFIKPLMDEEDDKNSALKETLWKSNNSGLKKRLSGGPVDDSEEVPLTRNKFDHLKLIDLACRHIALAALSASCGVSMGEEAVSRSPSPPESRRGSVARPSRKKRRRGGVLGFKELASKSNLSPWHFHRVFKSVTGQTPKAYGDKCWEYISRQEAKHPDLHKRRDSIIINTRIANPTLANEEDEVRHSDDDKDERSTISSSEPEKEPEHIVTPLSAPVVPVEPDQLFKQDFNLAVMDDFTSPLEATTPLTYDPSVAFPGSATMSPNVMSTVPSSATSFQLFDEIDDLMATKAPEAPLDFESYQYTPSMAYISNQQAQLQRQRQLEETEIGDDWLVGLKDDPTNFMIKDELVNYIG